MGITLLYLISLGIVYGFNAVIFFLLLWVLRSKLTTRELLIISSIQGVSATAVYILVGFIL